MLYADGFALYTDTGATLGQVGTVPVHPLGQSAKSDERKCSSEFCPSGGCVPDGVCVGVRVTVDVRVPLGVLDLVGDSVSTLVPDCVTVTGGVAEAGVVDGDMDRVAVFEEVTAAVADCDMLIVMVAVQDDELPRDKDKVTAADRVGVAPTLNEEVGELVVGGVGVTEAELGGVLVIEYVGCDDRVMERVGKKEAENDTGEREADTVMEVVGNGDGTGSGLTCTPLRSRVKGCVMDKAPRISLYRCWGGGEGIG